MPRASASRALLPSAQEYFKSYGLTPERLALVDLATGARLTYAQVNERACRLAIDAGVSPCPTTDQRGVARYGTVDIGAIRELVVEVSHPWLRAELAALRDKVDRLSK